MTVNFLDQRRSVNPGTFLILLCAGFVVTQVLWISQGADRAFTNAPQWVSVSRIFLVITALVVLLLAQAVQKMSRLDITIIWLLIALGLSSVVSDVYAKSFSLSAFHYGYLLIALAYYGVRRSRSNFSGPIIVGMRFVVWGSLALAFAAPNIAFNAGVSRIESLVSEGRLSGVVGDANTLSFIGVVFVFAVLTYKPKFWQIDFALVSILLILSQTRFSSVLAIIGVAFLFIKKYAKTKQSIVLLFSFFVSVAVYLVAMSATLTSKTVDGSDVWNTRLVIWQWATNAIASEGPLGLGLAGYNLQLANAQSYWVHTHNQFLQDMLLGGMLRTSMIVTLLLALSVLALKARSDFGVLMIASTVLYCNIEVPLFIDSLNFRFLTAFILVIMMAGLTNINASGHASSRLVSV